MASPNWIDSVLDAGLHEIADNVDRVDICHTEPTTYADATSTYSVASYDLTVGVGNGDWVITDGAVSGRKLGLTEQAGNNGTATGAANFIAFTKTTGNVLYGVIDGDGDTVNNGSPVTITAVDVWEIKDPT